ncbi:MAG: DUF5671 domain-containing protein [Patescibacteria group bacterium]
MENQINQEKPRLRPLFFFLSAGVLISLITSIVSFLNLAFETLNKKFPDVLNATYQYGYNSYNYENLRAALATLIIIFPIFLVLVYFWNKIIKTTKLSKVEEIIKKWMVYLIIFLASVVIIVDLVVLVRYFVSGEITNRFIYKILVTLVTAGVVGKYFFISEFWPAGKRMFKINVKNWNKIVNPTFSVLLVLATIAWSFTIVGSPMKQRLLRLDDRRVQDLQSIQWQVINYWQQKEKLPESIDDLKNPISGYSLPVEPEFEKGKIYEYSVKDAKNLTFELCADFSTDMPKGWQEYQNYYGGGEIMPMYDVKSDMAVSSYPYPGGGTNESWDHETGRTCFERTIDKDLYPPYPEVLKN